MTDSPRVAAVALLMLALLCGTVLCAIGVMTKTEMLPLLGGTVVVAHRLLDGAMPKLRKPKETEPQPKEGDSTPPPSLGGAGVPVVFGMLGGGLAGMLGMF